MPDDTAASLLALQQVMLTAKSRDDPGLRRATPEEIALAESQRKDWHCSGFSHRTGLPCRKYHTKGTTVCPTHGATLKEVREAAARRIAAMVDPILANMLKTATQSENLSAAVKAGADLLDRGGIGEVVQAKVRSSHQGHVSGVTVNIGFLQAPEPPAIEATAVTVVKP